MGLSWHEKKMLVQGARCAVRDFLERGITDDASVRITDIPPALLEARGVFVTVYHAGRTRGCMGTTADLLPLWQACRVCARNAAYKDPRFPPLTVKELPLLSFEIVVVGAIRPFRETSQIRGGTCGLILQKGARREVFLPGSLKTVPGELDEAKRHLRDVVAIDTEGGDMPEVWSVFEADVITQDKL